MVPIVLVTGFLSPSNYSILQTYWGEAAKLSEKDSPIIIAQVASIGSAHDRSCELFAQLLGQKVDFGKDHSDYFKHNQYGRDYTNEAQHPNWSEEKPVHLVGHSFGRNTIRYFVYLVSIDYWKFGTSTKWIKSVTTLSSPIKGTLLTYALGGEHKIGEQWVDNSYLVNEEQKEYFFEYLSPSFLLYALVHFESIFSNPVTKKVYDAGLDHFNLRQEGISGLFYALRDGNSGGGTPPVWRRDNAAFDLSMEQALLHQKLYKKHVDHVKSNLREYHFIATRHQDYSLKDSRKIFRNHQKSNPGSSTFYSSVIVFRDIATSWLSSKIQKHVMDNNFENMSFFTKLGLRKRLINSDGLCSSFSQYCDNSIQLDLKDIDKTYFSSEVATEKCSYDLNSSFKSRMNVAAGIHRIELKNKNHFGIVPFPDNFVQQKKFFTNLFNVLRTLD
eukprot:maker-scaffold_43-snap-gene-1.28-mRNA-1 protein AED:0.00 eAED:0.00 QI:48/1/1/1/1/1/2/49/442